VALGGAKSNAIAQDQRARYAPGMRRLARRLLMILCALAVVGGSTISVAVATPCVHEHSASGRTVDHARNDGGAPARHDNHGAGCLGCCVAACAAMAGLAPRPVINSPAFAGMAMTWWETGALRAGRSIEPDTGPPRTIV
jgi:hypothetical protein